MFRNHLTLAVVTTLVCVAKAANAAEWDTCANGKKYRWKLNQTYVTPKLEDFQPGTAYATALQEAVTAMSNTPANFKFAIEYDFDGFKSVNLDNGRNEAWFSTGISQPAKTYTWVNSNCEIDEADLVFKKGYEFTTAKTKISLKAYGGVSDSFQAAAIYTLARVAGLKDSTTDYGNMGEYFTHLHTQGGQATAYPGQDVVDALMGVYGKVSAAHEDVSVSHWRNGAPLGLPGHVRTRVLSKSTGKPLSKIVEKNEPIYLANPNQDVKVEFTYENLGKTLQNPVAAIYLSSDSVISTSDTLLKTHPIPVGAGDPFTHALDVKIPSFVVHGTRYYLGVIVDYNNQIAEKNEANNSTYVGIQAQYGDLGAMLIEGPKKAKKGKFVHVRVEVAGASFYSNATYSIVLSKDPYLDMNDHELFTGSLHTGLSEQVIDHALTLPKNLKGKFYWGLVVHTAEPELSELNNVLFGGKVKIK